MKIIKIDDVQYVEKEKYDSLNLEIDKKRHFKIINPENVMAMVSVEEIDGKLITSMSKEFIYLKSDKARGYVEYNGEVVELYLNKEKYARVSLEYVDKAKSIFGRWNQETLNFYVNKDKDKPVLLWGEGNLGFILAPRISEEEDE